MTDLKDRGTGAPELIRKNGLALAPMAREAKLSAESHVVRDPVIDISHKIGEVLRG